MQPIPRGNGRPKDEDSKARRREMLRLMAVDGLDFRAAAKKARVKADAVLYELWTQDEFWAVCDAIRAGRLGPTAVTLATHDAEQDAA